VLARGVEDWIFSRGSSFVTSQQLPMKGGRHKHKQAAGSITLVPEGTYRKTEGSHDLVRSWTTSLPEVSVQVRKLIDYRNQGTGTAV
jgi:hypothetical protein